MELSSDSMWKLNEFGWSPISQRALIILQINKWNIPFWQMKCVEIICEMFSAYGKYVTHNLLRINPVCTECKEPHIRVENILHFPSKINSVPSMRVGINWLRLNGAEFGKLATENERIPNLFSLAVLRIGGSLAGQMFGKRVLYTWRLTRCVTTDCDSTQHCRQL